MLNKRLAPALLSTLCALTLVTAAHAGDRSCDGLIVGEVIDENIKAVGACTLLRVTVYGNVKVEPDATLVFIATQVHGNVESHGGVRVAGFGPPTHCGPALGICPGGNLITGNYQLKRLTGVAGEGASGYVGEIEIQGHVEFNDNPMGMLAQHGSVGGNIKGKKNTEALLLINNTVLGHVEVTENSGLNTFVVGNSIDGNLKCSDNTPLSFISANNTVGGKAAGQCESP